MLQRGESIPAIETYRGNNGNIYIQDGHHRYVAYKALGLEPKIIIYNTGGPIGYKNWVNTTYQKNPYKY